MPGFSASWEPRRRRGRAVPPCPGGSGLGRVLLALGSMGLAIGATAAVLHPGDNPAGSISSGQGVLVALIWIVIGAVNLAYANRN